MGLVHFEFGREDIEGADSTVPGIIGVDMAVRGDVGWLTSFIRAAHLYIGEKDASARW